MKKEALRAQGLISQTSGWNNSSLDSIVVQIFMSNPFTKLVTLLFLRLGCFYRRYQVVCATNPRNSTPAFLKKSTFSLQKPNKILRCLRWGFTRYNGGILNCFFDCSRHFVWRSATACLKQITLKNSSLLTRKYKVFLFSFLAFPKQAVRLL